MSEFSDYDFKNWLAWALKAGRTVWAEICEQFPESPHKCFRAWEQFKLWAYEVTGRHPDLAPPKQEAEAVAR